MGQPNAGCVAERCKAGGRGPRFGAHCFLRADGLRTPLGAAHRCEIALLHKVELRVSDFTQASNSSEGPLHLL